MITRSGHRWLHGQEEGLGWSRTTGEIWICEDKEAQAGDRVSTKHKNRKVQCVPLRQRDPGKLRNMTSQRKGETGRLEFSQSIMFGSSVFYTYYLHMNAQTDK